MKWNYVPKVKRQAMLGRTCEARTGKSALACGMPPTDYVAYDGARYAFCKACRRKVLGASPWEKRMLREDREARQQLLGGGNW